MAKANGDVSLANAVRKRLIMINFRKSWLICGTICTVIVLALVVGAITYGSPTLQLFSHGANPVPPDDGTGNIQLTHGANPVPPDDGTGDVQLTHGANPVPPDDGTGDFV